LVGALFLFGGAYGVRHQTAPEITEFVIGLSVLLPMIVTPFLWLARRAPSWRFMRGMAAGSGLTVVMIVTFMSLKANDPAVEGWIICGLMPCLSFFSV